MGSTCLTRVYKSFQRSGHESDIRSPRGCHGRQALADGVGGVAAIGEQCLGLVRDHPEKWARALCTVRPVDGAFDHTRNGYALHPCYAGCEADIRRFLGVQAYPVNRPASGSCRFARWLQPDHNRAAAVNDDGLPGHVSRRRRRQEHRCTGNFLRLPDTAHRAHRLDLLRRVRVFP